MAQMVNPSYRIGFNTSRYWLMNLYKFQDLQEYLMSTTFIKDIKLLFTNPSDYIVSARIYPIRLNILLQQYLYEDTIHIGNISATDLTNYKYSRENNLVQCGIIASYKFEEYFKSFLDYEPFTKIQVYLPYYDFVDIDVNMYMGKQLDIGLNVDLSTGLGLYYFMVDDNVVETYNAKFGIEIPLSNSNANEIARNMLLTGLNVTKQIVGVSADYSYKSGLKSTSKNIGVYETATMGQLGIGSTIDFINTNQKKFLKSSQPSGFLDFTKPQSCYLIISRPNIQRPSNYNHTIGRPSGKTSYLYDLKGFTIVDEIHLDGFNNATQSELNEIETLLKSGVIL